MLEHVAIWTRNLEEMKEFYCDFFNGKAGEKYESTSEFHAGFESYFINFGEGSRLELMKMITIPDGINSNGHEAIGITHIAFSAKTTGEVDGLAKKARSEGYTVVLEPHKTGDGYYEACILDPDGNRVEVTVLP
ncbi:MAG: VOC family protein [Lachnospiraceae bacterium]|nr:VOC family protein [Lachnospiraceae bacterium]